MRKILFGIFLALNSLSNFSQKGEHEPLGGLIDMLLRPNEVGTKVNRRISLLFDPSASPSFLSAPKPDPFTPKKKRLPTVQDDPELRLRHYFQEHFTSNGAEAQVDVEYCDDEAQCLSMGIIRYKTKENADQQWSLRRSAKEFRRSTVQGREVIWVEPGQEFPGKVTGPGGVLLQEGRYIISVGPGRPAPEDPALRLAWKQADRIRKRSEPADAPNPAMGTPVQSRPPVAPGR